MTTYILGAGPCGLAVLDGLVDKGELDYLLIEAGNQCGGLAQTEYWEGVGYHDLGPHKLFSTNKNLIDRIVNRVGHHNWLTQEKKSSIFLESNYLSYPPNPLALIRVYGVWKFSLLTVSFFKSKIKKVKSPIQSFESDLIGRMGRDLYELLFSPIAKKIWGNPKELSVSLAKGRVQTPSLSELALSTFGVRKKSNFEALTFIYPKNGLKSLWDAITARAQKSQILLNHRVTSIKVEQDNITEISLENNDGFRKILVKPEDFVVSTLPISLVYKSIKNEQKVSEIDFQDKLKLNDLVLVFFHTSDSKVFSESWLFVPDKNIIFHRLSEQASFDPGMVESGGILCAEVMVTDDRNQNLSDDQITKKCIDDLSKMLNEQFVPLKHKVIRLTKSYPVYKIGYEQTLNSAIRELDSLKNFRTVGRQGSYNYIGTLDAMDIGYGFVDWLLSNRPNWDQERIRTSNYPILD